MKNTQPKCWYFAVLVEMIQHCKRFSLTAWKTYTDALRKLSVKQILYEMYTNGTPSMVPDVHSTGPDLKKWYVLWHVFQDPLK